PANASTTFRFKPLLYKALRIVQGRLRIRGMLEAKNVTLVFQTGLLRTVAASSTGIHERHESLQQLVWPIPPHEHA
ncbi:hypothetical protein J8I87_43290, partial [Paraburkholderia sp. LEh10]|uniref:hypothetical protein n=1 Tax=Paraburkholderia sp. LEh10 TaxID=2821353 RepID=UPI001AE1DB4A